MRQVGRGCWDNVPDSAFAHRGIEPVDVLEQL